MMSTRKALVLLSGGQDSAVCLAWALTRYSNVETIGFDYGQRHAVELTCREIILKEFRKCFPKWSERLGVDHTVDLKVLGKISDTALTRDAEIRLMDNGLPNTFVPGRNIMFLTIAAAVACRRGLSVIVGGMCQTDFSGYPDCRDDTIKALQVCLNAGMSANFIIETPLMWIDKAQTWQLAETLGGSDLLELVRTETHTCYMGDRTKSHAWGQGCGGCSACLIRAKGYESYFHQRKLA